MEINLGTLEIKASGTSGRKGDAKIAAVLVVKASGTKNEPKPQEPPERE